MRILLLHQYFKTPKDGGGIRSYYIVKALVAKGHQVFVITSHNQKERVNANIEGAEVIYLPVYYNHKLGFQQRIRAFLLFIWKAYFEAKKIDSDIVYAISTPLSIGFLALLIRKPFVFEVGDLWPDVPIQMKILRNRILKFLSLKLEKKIYKKASLIVSLSVDIRDRIIQKWPHTRNIVIENFSDLELFQEKNFSQSNTLGNFGKAIIKREGHVFLTYVGTAGEANDLMQMVELANLAEKNFPQFQFYMMISGKEEDNIKTSAPGNMHFIDFGEKEKVAELLALTDFNFVCYAQFPLLGSGSPNKFFDGLAAACVTVINVKGWIEKLILKENAGLFWDGENPEDILNKIAFIHKNGLELIEMRNNAINLAGRFNKDYLVPKLIEEVEKVN